MSFARERREENELIGGDAVLCEPRLRVTVERQVRSAQGDRNFASGSHFGGFGDIRAFTHDLSKVIEAAVRMQLKKQSLTSK